MKIRHNARSGPWWDTIRSFLTSFDPSNRFYGQRNPYTDQWYPVLLPHLSVCSGYWDMLSASTLVVPVILSIQAVGRGASDFAAPLIILSLRLYAP